MAANIPQMVPNGQMMMLQQQQQHQQQQQQPPGQQSKQLNNLVYSHLMQTTSMAPVNSWQAGVSIGDRFSKAVNLVSNTILAFPNSDWQKLCTTAMELEKKAFLQSPDKQSYDHAMAGRTAEMVKRRQGHVPDLQNQITSDAARQAQMQAAAAQQRQQMMLNQMAARSMGQPPQQGFQPMQNPMQVPVMPQQPQQIGMGMAHPGMLQNRPDQRQFPVARQPGVLHVDPLSRLSQQDRLRVNDQAAKMVAAADENQKNQIRQFVQQRMTPAQFQECLAAGKDPVFTYFQNQVATQLMRARAGLVQQQQQQQQQQRPGMPTNVMQPGPHQGQMNPALLAMNRPTGMPDGQSFTPNMESIRTEQQIGLLAQQAGQMVVPASGPPGRNATPGPMAGIPPQPTPGNQSGPNQTPRVTQVQAFGMPQAKMEPAAAQVQAQAGVRAVPGRPMPGQPGAMAAPGAPAQPSQSPAMGTLNAPMHNPPIPMGQANQPMAAGLNPQFSHQNNTRPSSLQGTMGNPAVAGMVPNLNSEARPGMQGLAENGAMREFYAKLQQEQQRAANNGFQGPKPGLMPGIPGQLQPGAMGGPNQAGMLNPNQKGNGVMQSGPQQNMMQPPQQPVSENAQLLAIAQTPQGRAAMNTMDIPAAVLNRLRSTVQIPAEVRKWAHLRQFLQANPGAIPPQLQPSLSQWQMLQFKALLERKKAGAGPQPANGLVPQQPGPQQPALPPGFSYPPNLAHVPRQEIEAARQREPRFQGVPDENVAEVLRKHRRDTFVKRAWEQFQLQQARGNNNALAGFQKPGVPTPTTQQAGVPPAAHPNVPQGVPPQAAQQKPPGVSTADAAPAPGPSKQARPPPNPSPAPAPKNLKRPKPDDITDATAQPGNVAQRPAPPSGAPAAAPKPTMEQLMNLSPEQLAKLPPEQQQKIMSMRARAGQPGNNNASVNRLRELANEGSRLALLEAQQGVDVPTPAPDVPEARLKILKTAEKIKQLRGSNITRWYQLAKDDSRARMFFKIRFKVAKQFVDPEQMTRLQDSLTMPKDELDPYINMIDSMLQDIGALKRSASQDGPAAGAQADGQRPPQPAPLSAANLEKQTQALKQAQSRTAAKPAQPAQPPAAPTTSQPPFQFGVQKLSPAGNPEYYGEQRITQANLVIPPRKKARTGAAQASPSMGQQPTPSAQSPQVNAPSPAAVRKPEPPKLMCPELGCEMSLTGFATEEALNAHRLEEHIKPMEDPIGYMQEHMTAALGLDAQGNPKNQPKPNNQAVSTPASAPMAINHSKQGQKPAAAAAAATPMSRTVSMQRQASTPGGKPGAAKQQPGAGTPQPNPALAAAAVEDPWAYATVDPHDLYSGLARSLDAVTGSVVPDFGTYRSLTPNDTPGSSKDSGASEPTSDIAENAALDINLSWQQGLDGDLLYDMKNINMENFGSPDLLDVDMFGGGGGGGDEAMMMYTMLDMEVAGGDFSKPFKVDQELFGELLT